MKKIFFAIRTVLVDTIKASGEHNLMNSAAAIAFYAIFSLPGLLIAVVLSAGVFFGEEAVRGELSGQISDFVGKSAADTIEQILKNIELDPSKGIQSVVGIGVLFFSATTIFMSLQSALNTLWGVRSAGKRALKEFALNRTLSFGMIIALGFVLIFSLLMDTLLTVFLKPINQYLQGFDTVVLELANGLFSFVSVVFIVTILFKFLPDVRLQWKNVAMGALITSGMLVLGRFLIGIYMSQSNFGQTYAAASSVVILLVWVFYSTVVLLFGAELTRSILNFRGYTIRPSSGAKKVELREVELD
ncbi:YihY/virulence factor BrkB family protein [Reichenbachiella agariperforans]|uniref:Membrane protein n=1 Tax=Reichenbachiella agariperforans TaxID=156994 RepID=A0A1M6WF25_REIAG|nr:YihY/virulence factor BrkB family protein [Reichenbachiella agariperforans]MBU2912461.1 YihY/virulence factor BrkB family protein [Reichenbachiella agariperforans]SHK92307.1 membrane protein [Reichenbachiella agariperforans]